jgi:hypothetical protein
VRTVLILFLLMMSSWARAGQVDLSLWGDYRSFPQSGVAEAVVGYDQLLWGDPKNTLYGFARVYGEFDAITQYAGTTLKAEIFPISFLGVRVGQGWSQNHEALEDFDCTKNLCTGFFSQQFIEGQLFLGAGPIKFSGTYRFTAMSLDQPAGSDTYYIDPESGLQYSTSATDHLQRARGLLAYEINKNFRLGYALTLYNSDISNEASRLWMGYIQFMKGPLNIIAGGGEFYSTIQLTHPTAVVIGQWTFYPRLGF